MPNIRRKQRKRGRTYIVDWSEFRRIKQGDAAQAIEFDQSTLSRLEKGLIPYNQDQIEKLAQLFRCQPEDLLTTDPFNVEVARKLYFSARDLPAHDQEILLDLAMSISKRRAGL